MLRTAIHSARRPLLPPPPPPLLDLFLRRSRLENLLLFHRAITRLLSSSLPKNSRNPSSSPTISRTLSPTLVSFDPATGNSSSLFASFRSRFSLPSSPLRLVFPPLSLRLQTVPSTSSPPPTLLSNCATLPPPLLSQRVFPPSSALPLNNSPSNAPTLSPLHLARGPTLSKTKSYNSPLGPRVAFPLSLAPIDSPPLLFLFLNLAPQFPTVAFRLRCYRTRFCSPPRPFDDIPHLPRALRVLALTRCVLSSNFRCRLSNPFPWRRIFSSWW